MVASGKAGSTAGKRTFANPAVLEFYAAMPFNLRDTAEQDAEATRAANPVAAYPVLEPLLVPGAQVLDVGCGAGWFANAIAWHYGGTVTGIDFNQVAVERAAEVAALLRLDNHFRVHDLFTFRPEPRFDLVICHGVLHHTDDCLAGVRHLCRSVVAPGGHAMIGLYHAVGRRPFLDHFADLKESGASEDQMFAEYRALHGTLTDETHVRSWFRDQVLHPHETQHTLAEILPVLADEGMELMATSINEFRPFESVEGLLEAEKTLGEVAETMLMMRTYYPGFFEVLARKAT